jgi:hypothetical protein
VSNLRANARNRLDAPAACSHTKSYVAKHPGTEYHAAGTLAAVIAKMLPTHAALRVSMVNEAKAAAARGVKTPAAALRALAGELDLDESTAVMLVNVAAPRNEIDL